MSREAIILAGGLGTRLRSAVPDLPKCMAPIAGKPFLAYVIEYLREQGVDRIIFSLGYKHEAIESFLQAQHSSLDYSCSIEAEPLGTGGAIRKACTLANVPDVAVVNGDTYFHADLDQLWRFQQQQAADCTLALKPMKDSDRYGVVEVDESKKITSFKEKKWYADSLINGGVYLLNVQSFRREALPEKFSFEKDYLEALYRMRNMYGYIQDEYFIDIGIPEDYARAQLEFVQS